MSVTPFDAVPLPPAFWKCVSLFEAIFPNIFTSFFTVRLASLSKFSSGTNLYV